MLKEYEIVTYKGEKYVVDRISQSKDGYPYAEIRKITDPNLPVLRVPVEVLMFTGEPPKLQTGWICPRCDTVQSPFITFCSTCSGDVKDN